MREPQLKIGSISFRPSFKYSRMKQDRTVEARSTGFLKLHCAVQSPEAAAGSEEHEQDGEMFGVILSRSRSVSFASTLALKTEKENSALEDAVKRAFALRRSASVSRGYYKMFRHCDPVADDEMRDARKPRKKRGKMFEACRRLIDRVLA